MKEDRRALHASAHIWVYRRKSVAAHGVCGAGADYRPGSHTSALNYGVRSANKRTVAIIPIFTGVRRSSFPCQHQLNPCSQANKVRGRYTGGAGGGGTDDQYGRLTKHALGMGDFSALAVRALGTFTGGRFTI